MFKQNIKKRSKNKLMRCRRKKKQKNTECVFMLKRMGCAQGRKMGKINMHKNTQNYKLQNLQNLVLDK